MKSVFTLLFFTITFTAKSQNYFPFPDSNAIWVNTVFYCASSAWNNIWECELVSVVNYCVNGEDTVINSITYTKLDTCEGGYKGAIRDNSGKVLFVPAESLNEYLLYDFTAMAGDTLDSVYFKTGTFDEFQELIVSQVDSVQIFGEYRKRVGIEQGPGWIEGIGNEYGLFRESWINISGIVPLLYCMSDNDTKLYPIEGPGNCTLDVGLHENESTIAIDIYPNPVNDVLNISISSDNFQSGQIKIIDLTGQPVYQQEFEPSTLIEVNCQQLKPGIYLVKIEDSNANLLGASRFVKN